MQRGLSTDTSDTTLQPQKPAYGPFIADYIVHPENTYTSCIFKGIQMRDIAVGASLIFENCDFHGYCDLEGVIFNGLLEFRHCTFHNFVMFRGARLPDRTVFEDCRFLEGVSFAAGLSRSDAATTQEVTLQHLRFRGTSFSGYVTFNNRTFNRATDFQKCNFIDPPHFQNTIFHQGTRFDEAIFHRIKTNDQTRIARAELAFRRLKSLMRDVGDVERQSEFLALELESRRRRKEVSYFEKFMILLYDLGSNFGRSPMRPGVFLLVIAFLCWTALYTYALWADQPTAPDQLGWFIVEQTFAPFRGLESDYSPAPSLAGLFDRSPALFKAVSLVESSSALIALTLFVLALRRRFSA